MEIAFSNFHLNFWKLNRYNCLVKWFLFLFRKFPFKNVPFYFETWCYFIKNIQGLKLRIWKTEMHQINILSQKNNTQKQEIIDSRQWCSCRLLYYFPYFIWTYIRKRLYFLKMPPPFHFLPIAIFYLFDSHNSSR